MGVPFTVLGDKTDHGGTVVSAAPTSLTGGKPIARVGDKVPCPRCGDSNAVIVGPGDPTMIVDGAQVSLHGDKTSCGATIISSQMVTTAGGPGGKSASAEKVSANSENLAPADIALQSDAESFDDLPDSAKPYVFDQAERAGVFTGDDLLATAGSQEVEHETFDNGMNKFSTDDPEAAARTARAQLGLRPYQDVTPDRIMDTDPGSPEALAGGPGVHYKHLSQIDVHGGNWLARFADTRPVQGVAKPAYAPGALPKASASGQGMATIGTGMRTVNNVFQKGVKAQQQGLKQRIDIYQTPDGKKMAHMTSWSINQRTDTNEPTTLTKTQVSEALNDPAFKGLDDKMQKVEKDKLNEFYRSHFGG